MKYLLLILLLLMSTFCFGQETSGIDSSYYADYGPDGKVRHHYTFTEDENDRFGMKLFLYDRCAIESDSCEKALSNAETEIGKWMRAHRSADIALCTAQDLILQYDTALSATKKLNGINEQLFRFYRERSRTLTWLIIGTVTAGITGAIIYKKD